MKRNKNSTRAMRKQTSAKDNGTSRYALKHRSGRMMYGPGCCGHSKISKNR